MSTATRVNNDTIGLSTEIRVVMALAPIGNDTLNYATMTTVHLTPIASSNMNTTGAGNNSTITPTVGRIYPRR